MEELYESKLSCFFLLEKYSSILSPVQVCVIGSDNLLDTGMNLLYCIDKGWRMGRHWWSHLEGTLDFIRRTDKKVNL